MTERASWLVGSDSERIVTADHARAAVGGLLLPDSSAVDVRPGFRPGPASATRTPGEVYASDTPDGWVHVAEYWHALVGTRGQGGAYLTGIDGAEDIDVLGTEPADPANDRHDLIIGVQSDAAEGDADSQYRIVHLVGTPAGTPTDPDTTDYPDRVELARITVQAGATSITGADITDLRPTPLYTVALGGVLPIASSTERASLDPYVGQSVYRRDWGWVEVYLGVSEGWRVIGHPSVSTFSSLATAISSPYEGQQAYVRDVDQVYVYTGSAWISTRYSCRISRSTTQNVSTSTFTTIDFDTADSDLPGGMDDLANNRISIPVTGDWLVGFQTGMTGTDPDGARQAEILVNGGSAPVSINQASSGSGINPILNASGLTRLTAGDQLTMRAWQNSGSTLTTVTPTYMWAHLVTRTP